MAYVEFFLKGCRCFSSSFINRCYLTGCETAEDNASLSDDDINNQIVLQKDDR